MEEIFNLLHDFRSTYPHIDVEVQFTTDHVEARVGKKGPTGIRQTRKYTHEAIIHHKDYSQIFRRELVEMAEFIGG